MVWPTAGYSLSRIWGREGPRVVAFRGLRGTLHFPEFSDAVRRCTQPMSLEPASSKLVDWRGGRLRCSGGCVSQ